MLTNIFFVTVDCVLILSCLIFHLLDGRLPPTSFHLFPLSLPQSPFCILLHYSLSLTLLTFIIPVFTSSPMCRIHLNVCTSLSHKHSHSNSHSFSYSYSYSHSHSHSHSIFRLTKALNRCATPSPTRSSTMTLSTRKGGREQAPRPLLGKSVTATILYLTLFYLTLLVKSMTYGSSLS